MARGRTVEAEAQVAADEPIAAPAPEAFAAEFRELARQRRFVRASDVEAAPSEPQRGGDAAAAPSPAPSWRDRPAPRTRSQRTQAPASPSPVKRPADGPAPATAATPASVAPTPAVPTATRRPSRISDDQRAMLAELARMSDRLVESREQLVAQTMRADRAEAALAAAEDRMMAARALVHDAQRATRESAERCALLEGRCDALQEALELAVNASVVTRWRWRREMRRSAAAAASAPA